MSKGRRASRCTGSHFLAHGEPEVHELPRLVEPGTVTVDVGAMGECVRRWGIGSVVPPGDERALAEAIERALEPGPYRAAVEAIVRIRGELTWTRMAEATIEVYRSIVR